MSLALVCYQDIKDRLVYWFLFPIIALCGGILLYNNVLPETFKIIFAINVAFVLFLILAVYMYSKFKLKTTISKTFGLGDALLFLALAFTFSNVSFLILLVFGLIFSLALHLLLKKTSNTHQSVPLAGYLSLFFIIIYMSHWLGILKSVYII